MISNQLSDHLNILISNYWRAFILAVKLQLGIIKKFGSAAKYDEKVLLNYLMTPDDKIMYAIELMVSNDLKCIAVVRNMQPAGIVRLEDAFKKLGLRIPD